MSGHGTKVKISAFSTFNNPGKRPAQEDFQLVDSEKGIFVVADGFGGPLPGAEAAKTACESVKNFLFKEAGDLDATMPFVLRSYFSLAGNVLFNSLIYANRRVRALNKDKNIHEKGGASVIAGFIDGDLLAIANVGVCTSWMLRDGKAVELVVPRTFGRLCDPFSVETQEEFKVPLISIGTSEDLEPEIFEYKLKKGDWLIFESDGVPWSIINQLNQIKNKNLLPAQSVQEASKAFRQGNYVDNASISLIIL